MRSRVIPAIVLVLGLTATLASAQEVKKETVPGITNFSRLETTIACAGATTPAAVAEVKRLGYNAIINLRQASEAGANVEAEEAAAKTAGITYVHLPFNAASPDPTVVDRFLAAVHCASANRASALWMIKRMLVDGWDENRASAEATALGMTSPALRSFALEYVAAHKKAAN
jgi:uncharacterized protein (TIGR01244 family)